MSTADRDYLIAVRAALLAQVAAIERRLAADGEDRTQASRAAREAADRERDRAGVREAKSRSSN